MVDLLKKIINRHYLPGSKLPSTRELAKQARVNPDTTQRALQVLQDVFGFATPQVIYKWQQGDAYS